MRDLDPDKGMIGVRRLIRQHSTNEEGWRLPTGMDVDAYVRHLIHPGALHKHSDTAMIDQGEPIPFPKPDPGSSPPSF